MENGRYYILSIDPEPSVIGVPDGCAQAEILRSGYSDKLLHDRTIAFLGSFDSYARVNEIPNFNLELQCVKLKKKAIATDFIQFSPVLINCPYLVSQRTKLIFQNYETGNLKFYPASVFTQEGSKIEYFVFFCISLDLSIVDFENSVIYEGLGANEENLLKLRTLNEYESKIKSTSKFINFYKYCLNETFDESLDIFSIGATVFVKESLKNKLQQAGLSGLSMKPAFCIDNYNPSKILSFCSKTA